ncbi:hypothetical protein KK062_20170 [Fulvivirgaceae bacterium PWU5]|uniref:Uncharacterized protein n=1 Tax=Dawidia cretensis TaxID=2782350 RepID=A0AAP2E032_9BACT|nr:hypothetical protein [Dawidia cretensis]MBT1710571.1 hypothetical protein [Dawidia cretensis]
MNQQPDKLFRDKLSGLSRPVPPAAWDRISQGLQPPVRRIAPWKIAASILLPLAAGAAIYLYWHHDTTTGPTADQGRTPYIQTPIPTAVDTASTKTLAPVVVPAPVPAQRNTYTANTATTPKRIVTPTHPTEEASASVPAPDKGIPAQTDVPLTADAQTPATMVDKTPAATTPANTAVVPERSMTLVFNARETEAYLDKNSLDEATEDGKDASTFKKLLQKARDLKTNQDPIGDLRLKKNEILALNFKNDKRGQNK